MLETKTEQVQSQQARPRLKRYSLNKRDQGSYSQIFETETRKISFFETETETRKIVETETLADLTVGSIYNLDQT